MTIYKVSYVVTGIEHPGAIRTQENKPLPGEIIEIGGNKFIILEVLNLMPPRGDFHYLHATLRQFNPKKRKNNDLEVQEPIE
jgi:hypothetical protein